MTSILFTGRGGSGSWYIRGSQMAQALGADAVPRALDVAGYSVAVVVKRAPPDLVARIHRAGVPLVWDIVDAWPQPDGNSWSRDECMGWLRGKVAEIRPAGLVAATQAMAEDCAEFGVPVLALPHHARPGLTPTPIRAAMRVLAYEGNVQHLGQWSQVLEDECRKRGMTFHVNHATINDADCIVALRERTGYAPTRWKSNVKLANAQAAGLPILCAREAGYVETAAGVECWIDERADVGRWLDKLQPAVRRQVIAAQMVAAAPHLSDLAPLYREWLRRMGNA